MMETMQTTGARRVAIISLMGVCVLFVLALIAALKFSAIHTYIVSQGSMEPTLYRGDKIFVNEDYYKYRPPADDDLVAFRHGEALMVKRVSAVAGETIEGKDEKLIRNGVTLAEPYAEYSKEDSLDIETFASRRVPQGEIFVTGDSRDRSLDSRADEYGPVHIGDVVGRVTYIYWSSHPGQRGRHF